MSGEINPGGVKMTWISSSSEHPRGKTTPLFGGNHDTAGCLRGHTDGKCKTAKAWQLEQDGTCRARRTDYAEREGTFFTDGSGTSMPVWREWGRRPWAEAEGCEPTPEVLRELYDAGRREIEATAKHYKYSLTEVRTLLSEFDAKYGHLVEVPKLAKPERKKGGADDR